MTDKNNQSDSSAEALGVSQQLQMRNLIVYVILVTLTYLTAPITYIDVTHAALIAKLTNNTRPDLANLPNTASMWMTVLPILATWLLPYRWIAKRMVIGCYLVQAAMGGLTALAIATPTSVGVKISMLIAHGAVLGACSAVGGVYVWEIIYRGMSEKLRGWAFGFAFGAGPLFAVIGSRISQEVLGKKHTWISYPNDFALLFGMSLPMIAVMAIIGLMYYVPPEGRRETQIAREPFLQYVFGGFGSFVRQRTFLILLIGYVVCQMAWSAYTNGSLNIPNVFPGHEPKDFAGRINEFRFGGKMIAGFILGILAARLGARSGVIGTAFFTAAGILMVMTLSGSSYFGAFALFGAGELYGVYYPNFCMMASRPEHIKRNLALFSLAGLIPYSAILGVTARHGSLHTSFVVALVAGVVAVALAFLLPYLRPAARAGNDVYPGPEDNLKEAMELPEK